MTPVDREYSALAAAEKKATRLAAANRLLRESGERLSDSDDLNAFLKQVLRAVAEQLDAPEATLWINDLERGLSHLHLVYEHGAVLLASESSHPNAASPSVINEAGRRVLSQNRVAFIKTEEMLEARQRDYFRKRGIRGFLSIPVLVQGNAIGSIAGRVREGQPDPTADELDLAQALAAQAGIALHLVRLGEKANQAAVAQARLAILARSNEALRRTAEKLLTEPNLDAFLGQTLQALVETFGASGGALWRSESEELHLLVELRDGAIHHSEASVHPTKRVQSTSDKNAATRDVDVRLMAGEIVTIHVSDEYGFDATAQSYLASQGVKRLVLVPLEIGGRHLGRFSIRLADARALSPDEIELAKALATQAALAMELTRMASETQSAAVAAGRAESLTRANRAMHKSLATLTDASELDQLLGQVLITIVEKLGEEAGGVWLVTDDDSYLHLMLDHGKVQLADRTNHPAAGKRISELLGASAHHSGNVRKIRQNVAYLHGPEEIATLPDYAGFRDYLQSIGVRSILTIPLFAGETCLGSVTVRGRRHESYPSEDIEFAQTLANQASLALHISRLAGEAQQAAIAREREAAAKARAEKLAAANRLLRESAERLGAIDDIDDFLGQVLLTIHDLLGGHSATVWLRDNEAGLSHLRYVVEQGRAIPAAQSSHPNAATPHRDAPFAGDLMPGYGTGSAQPYEMAVKDNPGFTAEQRAHLQELGVRSMLSVPMVLSGSHFGTFTIRLTDHQQPLLKDDLELIQALANQAAVALHLTRLAEQAKHAAIAQEREMAATKRAETLARANAAIRSSLNRLAERQSLDGFLSEAVVVCARELGAVGAGIWLRNEGEAHRLVVSYEDGEVRLPGRMKNPGATTEHDTDEQQLRRGEITVTAGSVLRSKGWYPLYKDYLESRGIVALASLPLFVGERWAGTIVLRYAEEFAFADEKRELAFALANQVALALELTRLGDEARAAAIAQEREKAAEQRASELAKANAAIRSTLDAMTSIPALDDLLSQVLVSIVQNLDSPGSTIWLFDEQGSTLHLTCIDGIVYRDAPLANGHRVAKRLFLHDQTVEARDALMAFQHSFLRDAWNRPDVDEETSHWMRAVGAIGLLLLPLRVGASAIGVICVHKPDNQPFPAERTELAAALVQQAALAMHVARLAEEANQAAITREQEKAAKLLAAELKESNDTIGSTMTAMTSIPAVDTFLGQVMTTINKLMSAASSTLWDVSESERRVDLRLVCVDGQIASSIPPAGGCAHAGSFVITPTFSKALNNGPTEHLREVQEYSDLGPATIGWFKSRGVRSVFAISIKIGGAILSRLAIHLTDNEPIPQHKQELAVALVQQAALAMHMARLAEEARAAAIAQEREQAAEGRAAELAHANTAMRESLDQIAEATDLDQMKPRILRSFVEIFGGVSGSLWRFDGSDGSVTLEMEYIDGTCQARAASKCTHDEKHFFLPGHAPSYEKHQRLIAGEMLTLDVATSDLFVLSEREHLISQGTRTLIVVPLAAGGRHLARLALAFREQRQFTASERELAVALASQAALALEMHRLAHKAQQSALMNERNRMAMELHDTLAQGFAAIGMQIKAIERSGMQLPEEVSANLDTVKELAHINLVEARRSVRALRSFDLTQGGLESALERLVARSRRLTAAALELKIGLLPALPRDVEDQLLRIAQEAITNAIVHASAAAIRVSLVPAGVGDVLLSVIDDGSGFDPEQPTAGLGLQSIQRRASGIGAELTVVSEPGGGTQVILTLHLQEKDGKL